MKKVPLALALLTVVTLGTNINPASADQATVQQSGQNAVITGNNNVINQQTIQINVQKSKNLKKLKNIPNNTGVVQNTQQNADVLGNRNYSDQNSVQINKSYEQKHNRGRHRGLGHKNKY